ncbi:uncharacterized protein LOC106660038 [Trichogramma pretiosum]|uniref:uncharacterized protein LOC106660038 n=1 Tax=Trichogramma pretiosum TaxID=7493 RepID=UPI0006C997C9|nr:uncharacterized protein LOC106660038 [Trichogramma pretiosum]
MHVFPTRGKLKVTVADHFNNKRFVDKLNAWLQAVNLKEICKNDCVCSRHFTGNDFCVPGTESDTLKKAELQDAKKICEDLLENQNSSGPQYLHFEPEVNMVQEVYEADVCASDESKCKFMEFLTSEKKLSAATGIENFDIFNTIQNLCYSFLAIIFNSVSEQRCQRIFTETLVTLSKVLKGCIRWPSRDEIRKNIPLCFEDFEDTRIVLDYTEIFIQNPKEICCQIIAYSYYKGNVTLKFMTGVTPAGDISFISKVYGGRTSDSKIFEQSELMTLLQPGDYIMVDCGFLIEELYQKNQTPKVAKARVRVERSNQRIKAFEVLGSTMPSNLVPFAEDIMTVELHIKMVLVD